MREKRNTISHRKGTRDKFQERLQNRSSYHHKEYKPWYRQRHNFYPLLMLFVFIVLIMIVKAVYNVQEQTAENQNHQEQSIDEQEPMDYETAKKIFGG